MLFRGAKWTTARILERIGDRRPRSLELHHTSADDELLLALAGGGRLENLDLSSRLMTDQGIRAIARQCPLRGLFIREAPNVTDDVMPDIASCHNLAELYLDGTGVSDEGIGHTGSLPNLGALSISRTAITDIGIERIASNRIHLVNFDETVITGTGFSTWSVQDKMSFYTSDSWLNDAGFGVVCRAFPWLWNIVIVDTRVTNVGLKSLAGQSPTSIRINGSKIDREGILWLIENTEVQGIECDLTQFTKEEAKHYENYQGRYLQVRVYD